MPRRCEASLLLNIRPNILRICMNRNIRTTATNVQTIVRCKLQHFFFELLWIFPFSPPLFPVCIPVPEEDAVGGRRKLPAPLLGIIPVDRLVFLRCSPCSSLGGRRACRELILFCVYRLLCIVELYFNRYLCNVCFINRRYWSQQRFLKSMKQFNKEAYTCSQEKASMSKKNHLLQ